MSEILFEEIEEETEELEEEIEEEIEELESPQKRKKKIKKLIANIEEDISAKRSDDAEERVRRLISKLSDEVIEEGFSQQREKTLFDLLSKVKRSELSLTSKKRIGLAISSFLSFGGEKRVDAPDVPISDLIISLQDELKKKVVDIPTIQDIVEKIINHLAIMKKAPKTQIELNTLLNKITKANKLTTYDRSVLNKVIKGFAGPQERIAARFREEMKKLKEGKPPDIREMLSKEEKEDYDKYLLTKESLYKYALKKGRSMKTTISRLNPELREWYLEADKKYKQMEKSIFEEMHRPTILLGEDITLGEIYGKVPVSEIKERKVIPKKGVSLAPIIPSTESLLASPINFDFRRYIREILVRDFSSVMEKVSEKPLDVEQEIVSFGIRPWKGVEDIIWDKKRKGYRVLFSFEDKDYEEFFPVGKSKEKAFDRARHFASQGYYDENLMRWFHSQEYEAVKTSVENDPETTREIQRYLATMNNPDEIIHDLERRYGLDIFRLDAVDFKNALSSPSDVIKPIDVQILNKLERFTPEELKNVKPSQLRQIVTDAIADYISKYHIDPTNVTRIMNLTQELIHKKVMETLKNMEPDDEQIEAFDAEYKDRLKDEYKKQLLRYREIKKKKKVEPKPKKYPKIEDEVSQFEEKCYVISEKDSIYDYLYKVLFPLIFISPPLKDYALFFSSKLKSREFPISLLPIVSRTNSELPYYFPELAMNFKTLSKDKWDEALRELTRILQERIEYVANSFIVLKYQTRIPTRPSTILQEVFDWDKYLTSVIGKCQVDTQSGIKYSTEENTILDPVINEVTWENVPLKDVVICYDEKTTLFTCHDKDNVLREIALFKKPINPYTGEEYSKNFVDKMKKSYPKELARFKKEKKGITRKEIREASKFLSNRRQPTTYSEILNRLHEGINSVLYLYIEDHESFNRIWEQTAKDYAYMMIRVDALKASKLVERMDIVNFPSLALVTKKDGKLTIIRVENVENLDDSSFQKVLKEMLI